MNAKKVIEQIHAYRATWGHLNVPLGFYNFILHPLIIVF